MMMAFVLTIGAQAQQDDGMDVLLAAMIAAKIHQDSIDTLRTWDIIFNCRGDQQRFTNIFINMKESIILSIIQ